MLSEALHTILNNVTANNFPGQVPQSFDVSTDFIVFDIENTNPQHSKSGQRDIDNTRVQINIYSKVKKNIGTMSASVYSQMISTTGVVNNTDITRILFQNEFDNYIENAGDDQQGLHVCRQDYIIRLRH